MKQIIFGVFAEGPTDYRFFSILLERYLSHFCYVNQVDVDILPAILIKADEKYPSSFIDRMKHIEQEHTSTGGLPYVFIHNDADSRTLDQVLTHKWEPWLNECKNSSMWLAIIPIKMTEAWMLADTSALQSTFIIDQKSVQQIIGTSNPESINEPKSKLREIAKTGKQKRITNFEENLAKRINLELLEQLPSFQFLKEQIQERIR